MNQLSSLETGRIRKGIRFELTQRLRIVRVKIFRKRLGKPERQINQKLFSGKEEAYQFIRSLMN